MAGKSWRAGKNSETHTQSHTSTKTKKEKISSIGDLCNLSKKFGKLTTSIVLNQGNLFFIFMKSSKYLWCKRLISYSLSNSIIDSLWIDITTMFHMLNKLYRIMSDEIMKKLWKLVLCPFLTFHTCKISIDRMNMFFRYFSMSLCFRHWRWYIHSIVNMWWEKVFHI